MEASSYGKVGVWLDVSVHVLGRGVHVGCGASTGNGAAWRRTRPWVWSWVGAASGPVSCWDQEEFLKVPGSRKRGGTIVLSNLKPQYCLIVFLKNSPAI